MRRLFISTCLLLGSAGAMSRLATAQTSSATVPRLGKSPLAAVVAVLSDSEKVRLLVGVGLILPARRTPYAAWAFRP